MKLFLEFLNTVEEFAFYVARGKVKDQGRRGKGVGSEPEMTLAQGLDGNPALAALAQWECMHKVPRLRIIDATQQRQCVAGLQQAKVILDPLG